MNLDFAVDLYREMLRTTLLVAAPVLGAAMLTGLVVSLLQTLTSLNEQTLTFVPKIGAIALVVGLLLPWILTQLMSFLTLVLTHAPGLVFAS
jgi:flagellar biosynthetic protein FliQ